QNRRDFHRFAETGWTEFRTASLVARTLEGLGYEVSAGRDVLRDKERLGLPEPGVLEEHWQRARAQGGDPQYLEALKGGFTGVVGKLRQGNGPTVGLRFDMDALDLVESQDPAHRPVREGFVSENQGAMHACGHDAHTAIGLGVAEVLARLSDSLRGTVKLVFQPAEEGVRGARAMVAAGVVDDVDYMLGLHVYSGWDVGQVDPGRGGFLATTKFDALFRGAPAHAGGVPNQGKNALLAAATAVLNLQAIPRHRQGKTRINVGRLVAGTGRNVIPDLAHLSIESRGETTELNEYVFGYAQRILEAAAAMHDCSLEVRTMGGAQSADSDPALRDQVQATIQALGGLSLREPEPSGGSEDFTYMMSRVQENGGLAANIGIGAKLGGWGHHTAEFDIDERALAIATRLLSVLVLDLAG
ncbi:MAG: amidohydrolase, partial [Anaerolineae bacterium]|nr:amidohydrolase [Anaerolineae bacterium]